MIFKTFDETDIVAGRTTHVASGFWPDGETYWSASNFQDNFYSLTSSVTPSPAYGSSVYDVRKTMFYIDVYPNITYRDNNDPYFSVAYGNIYGDVGSGSFNLDTGSIKTYFGKAIYTQYKNLLLGIADATGKFSFKTGSWGSEVTIDADDIWVVNFSSYKMKDKIDAGVFEMSLSGSNGIFTFKDDSPFLTQASSVYTLITGSINDESNTTPSYQGVGLLYPSDGIVIFNCSKVADLVGLRNVSGSNLVAPFNYTTASSYGINNNTTIVQAPGNAKAFVWSIENSSKVMTVRKSEFVPARHYFIRVKNRDFNYSNNPTYVYDGTDGVHAQGTIYNEDFITDPKTYITTVGLYNSDNELIAVAKLSRPAVKAFDNELLVQVKVDF